MGNIKSKKHARPLRGVAFLNIVTKYGTGVFQLGALGRLEYAYLITFMYPSPPNNVIRPWKLHCKPPEADSRMTGLIVCCA